MPKILPTFAAVVIVGVCIAFNTMRYPVVWKMVGPQAASASSENSDSMAEVVSSATPAPPAPASVAPLLASEKPISVEPSPTLAETPLPAQPEPTSIVLPKENLLASEEPQGVGVKSISGPKPWASAEVNEDSEALVPVAKAPESAGVPAENFRRLPPVEPESPSTTPNNPPSPNTIYPSTGM